LKTAVEDSIVFV